MKSIKITGRKHGTPECGAACDGNINKTMGVTEWGLVVALAVIWGGAFFFVELALERITPRTIVLARVGFAAIALCAYMWKTGRKMPAEPGLWGAFFVMGAINNVIPFNLIVWGQKYIDCGLASILNATTPIFTVILAHGLTHDERLTVKRITGVAIGWLGVVFLIGLDALNGFDVRILGRLAVLGAACSYACAGIYGRRFRSVSPVVAAAGMLCASTIMTAPLALILDHPWNLEPDSTTWAALAGLSVISTALAYIIYFRVLATAGPTNLLLVTFLIPVSAILLGVVVLGERPGWNALAGMGLILIGLIAIDGRLPDRVRRRPEKGGPG